MKGVLEKQPFKTVRRSHEELTPRKAAQHLVGQAELLKLTIPEKRRAERHCCRDNTTSFGKTTMFFRAR